MKLNFFTVDAFTREAFSGNPAAVVPLLKNIDDDVLQKVAREFNLSETAYLTPFENSDEAAEENTLKKSKKFRLRWFTPTNEVPLCGHATLATAHVLFSRLGSTSQTVQFETLSGSLVARKEGKIIVLDFPANPPQAASACHEKLFHQISAIVSGGYPVQEFRISYTTRKLLVRLTDKCTRTQLESIYVNATKLLDSHDGSVVKGVILTLKGEKQQEKAERGLENYHFISRYFAPWNGIPEDPVTGAAHTVLAPYWADVLGIKTLNCRQCSARGGELTVKVRDDSRVDLAGEAKLITEGVIEF